MLFYVEKSRKVDKTQNTKSFGFQTSAPVEYEATKYTFISSVSDSDKTNDKLGPMLSDIAKFMFKQIK